MGSWYETCAMTGLPIYDGDEVVFFLIEKTISEDKSVFCYSHDEWAPRGIQLYGKYEDYGRYSIENSRVKDLTFNALKEQLFEMELGENEFHDIAVKRDKLSWNLINDAIHDSRLFVHNISCHEPHETRKPYKAVTRVAILKEVFDKCLEFKHQIYIPGGIEGSYQSISISNIPTSIEEYITSIKSEIDKYLKMAKTYKAGKSDKKLLMDMAIDRLEMNGPSVSRTNVLRGLPGVGGGSYLVSWSVRDVVREAITLVMADRVNAAIAILYDCAKFNLFCSFFESTRKRWVPTGGAGSQTEGSEEHRHLANTVISVLDGVKRRYDAENYSEAQMVENAIKAAANKG